MLPTWKLLGFIIYVSLYFNVLAAYEQWPTPSLKSIFFKILPILHLILIIVSTSTEDVTHMKSSSYRRYILVGLVFSLAGDIALVYIKDFFELGVLLFTIAQTLYVMAFGFRPIGNGPTAASFGVVATFLYMYIISDVKDGTDVKLMLLVYTALIFTMAWRSVTQFTNNMTVENFCACAGAILFITSDLLLAIDKFKGSFHLAPFWTMVAYYSAQLGISLSACNTHQAKFYSAVKKTE